MNSNINASFATRRDAELVVERLVQEFGVERGAIEVGPEGDQNSAGERPSGGDIEVAEPSVEARDDAPLESRIVVSVALAEGADSDAIRSAFQEFDGEQS